MIYLILFISAIAYLAYWYGLIFPAECKEDSISAFEFYYKEFQSSVKEIGTNA